jgi:hypothetical protein
MVTSDHNFTACIHTFETGYTVDVIKHHNLRLAYIHYYYETGYTVEIPSNATLLPLRNLTDSSGRCDFPCLLNDSQYPNYYPGQACFYAVTITEVIKGNYPVSVPIRAA